MLNKKIMAIIPARGGSKGIKRKNLYNICGHPLIYWTLKETMKIKFIDNIILTSDNNEILEYSKSLKCCTSLKRSKKLSEDDSKTSDVIIDVLEKFPGYDYFILLQPTSPLRTASDINNAFIKMVEEKSKCCISIYKTNLKANWLLKLKNDKKLKPLISKNELIKRRQDIDDTFLPNGAIYISEVKSFLNKKTFFSSNTSAYVMPKKFSIDIDNMYQMKKCEKILFQRIEKLAGFDNQLDEGRKFFQDEIRESI